MRHRVRTRRLGVRTSHRKAMMRNMVTSLMEHGRIVTTITRAKELRRLADRMVTLSKDGSLHARRQALSVIRDRHVVAKLFEEWGPMFADRTGGYTRIVRLGRRRGDATMMAVIELAVDSLKSSKKKVHRLAPSVAVESVIPEADSAVEVSAKTPEESTPDESTDDSPEKSVEAKGEEVSEASEGVQAASDASDSEAETVAASQTSADEEGAVDVSAEAGEDVQAADDGEQATSEASEAEDTEAKTSDDSDESSKEEKKE